MEKYISSDALDSLRMINSPLLKQITQWSSCLLMVTQTPGVWLESHSLPQCKRTVVTSRAGNRDAKEGRQDVTRCIRGTTQSVLWIAGLSAGDMITVSGKNTSGCVIAGGVHSFIGKSKVHGPIMMEPTASFLTLWLVISLFWDSV